jgi:uncharacterized protein YgiM (DUF1202 family)
MASRLTPGQSAKVMAPLYLRSSPGIQNNWLGTIQEGTIVEILGNPACIPFADGAYVWWQVKLADGTIGWSAEGTLSGKFYFLEPVK